MPYQIYTPSRIEYPDFGQISSSFMGGLAALASIQEGSRQAEAATRADIAKSDAARRQSELDLQKMLIEDSRDKRRQNAEAAKNLLAFKQLEFQQTQADIVTRSALLDLQEKEDALRAKSALSMELGKAWDPNGFTSLSAISSIYASPYFAALDKETRKEIQERSTEIGNLPVFFGRTSMTYKAVMGMASSQNEQDRAVAAAVMMKEGPASPGLAAFDDVDKARALELMPLVTGAGDNPQLAQNFVDYDQAATNFKIAKDNLMAQAKSAGGWDGTEAGLSNLRHNVAFVDVIKDYEERQRQASSAEKQLGPRLARVWDAYQAGNFDISIKEKIGAVENGLKTATSVVTDGVRGSGFDPAIDAASAGAREILAETAPIELGKDKKLSDGFLTLYKTERLLAADPTMSRQETVDAVNASARVFGEVIKPAYISRGRVPVEPYKVFPKEVFAKASSIEKAKAANASAIANGATDATQLVYATSGLSGVRELTFNQAKEEASRLGLKVAAGIASPAESNDYSSLITALGINVVPVVDSKTGVTKLEDSKKVAMLTYATAESAAVERGLITLNQALMTSLDGARVGVHLSKTISELPGEDAVEHLHNYVNISQGAASTMLLSAYKGDTKELVYYFSTTEDELATTAGASTGSIVGGSAGLLAGAGLWSIATTPIGIGLGAEGGAWIMHGATKGLSNLIDIWKKAPAVPGVFGVPNFESLVQLNYQLGNVLNGIKPGTAPELMAMSLEKAYDASVAYKKKAGGSTSEMAGTNLGTLLQSMPETKNAIGMFINNYRGAGSGVEANKKAFAEAMALAGVSEDKAGKILEWLGTSVYGASLVRHQPPKYPTAPSSPAPSAPEAKNVGGD